VLPDGSVLYGAQTSYNARRGHLMRFDADGNYLDAYEFGWDITPAVWEHAGTWSVVLKDNHYGIGMYCNAAHEACAPTQEEYFITQLNSDLEVEWRFRNTSDDGAHPNGFEWCINQPAIDGDGVVYVNAEDGEVYALPQGNVGDFTVPLASIFLEQAIGAAYTPLALGADGLLYTQNFGHLFVIGE
jgi:outer membrane protein assembly factor BamB